MDVNQYKWLTVLTVGLALSIVAAGCGSSAASTPEAAATEAAADERTFVGRVDGTDAFVAVVTDGDEVFAYLCDSEKIWDYLAGRETAGAITAGTASDLAVLEGTVSGDSLTGYVKLSEDDAEHAFVATAASGEAGFFTLEERADDMVTQGGWIRLADGSVRGKQVAVNVTAETTGSVGTDVGSGEAGASVPPTAEPASILGLAACGVAGVQTARAMNRFNRNPTAANEAAVLDAINSMNALCRGGAA